MRRAVAIGLAILAFPLAVGAGRGAPAEEFDEPCGVASDRYGTVYASDRVHVRRSTDGGLSWTDVRGTFGEPCGLAAYGRMLYVVDHRTGGVLVSPNAGRAWTHLGERRFRGPQDLAVADFDGDGRPDVAVSDSDAGRVSIFDGVRGTWQVLPPGPAVGPPLNEPTGLAAGDFDDDGQLDLAVADPSNGRVVFFPGPGLDTAKELPAPPSGFRAPCDVAWGGTRMYYVVDAERDAVWRNHDPTWRRRLPSSLDSVCHADVNPHGALWVAGGGRVIVSGDGGSTWQAVRAGGRAGSKEGPGALVTAPRCVSDNPCSLLHIWSVNVPERVRTAVCTLNERGSGLPTTPAAPLFPGIGQSQRCVVTDETRVVGGVRKRVVKAELTLRDPDGRRGKTPAGTKRVAPVVHWPA